MVKLASETADMRSIIPACLFAAAMSVGAVSEVHAQATTICSQIGGYTRCNTTADPALQAQQQMRDMNEQMRQQQSDLSAQMAQVGQGRAGGTATYSWRDVAPTKCSTLEKMASASLAYCSAREVAANRKAVGDLIAAGRCDDALKGALGTGDLDFARDVRAFCAAK